MVTSDLSVLEKETGGVVSLPLQFSHPEHVVERLTAAFPAHSLEAMA